MTVDRAAPRGGAVGVFGPDAGQLVAGLLPSGGTVSSRHLPCWSTSRKRSSVGFVTSGPSGTVRVRKATPGGGVTFQPTLIPCTPSS